MQTQVVEAEVQHECAGLTGVALAPVGSPDGVAQFAASVASQSDADETDEAILCVSNGEVVVRSRILARSCDVGYQAHLLVCLGTSVEAERLCNLRVADDHALRQLPFKELGDAKRDVTCAVLDLTRRHLGEDEARWELFEALTLVQTGTVTRFPVVLVDRGFWGPLVDWIRGTLVERGMISPEDPDLVQLVDTAEEAVACVLRSAGRADA